MAGALIGAWAKRAQPKLLGVYHKASHTDNTTLKQGLHTRGWGSRLEVVPDSGEVRIPMAGHNCVRSVGCRPRNGLCPSQPADGNDCVFLQARNGVEGFAKFLGACAVLRGIPKDVGAVCAYVEAHAFAQPTDGE